MASGPGWLCTGHTVSQAMASDCGFGATYKHERGSKAGPVGPLAWLSGDAVCCTAAPRSA
eukprot:6460913-Alexandrium_andersonii.AAC.1